MSNFIEELDYEFEEELPRASTPIPNEESNEDGDVTIEADVSGQLYRDNPDAVDREVRVLRLQNIKANRLGPIVPALASEIFQPASAYRVPTKPQRVFTPPAKAPTAAVDGAGPSKPSVENDEKKKKRKDGGKAKEEKKMKDTSPKPLSAAQRKFAEKKVLWRLRH